MARLLENQEIAAREEHVAKSNTFLGEDAAANQTGGNVAGFNPVLISLVRRAMPNLIAYDIAGVQPMTVPTGLIFDLDENQSLRIHPRSGLAWKQGVTVANCEGIVDADYVEQSYVMLANLSRNPIEIRDGMRIAQAEVVVNPKKLKFKVVANKPVQKTDRDGGFGSTGVH